MSLRMVSRRRSMYAQCCCRTNCAQVSTLSAAVACVLNVAADHAGPAAGVHAECPAAYQLVCHPPRDGVVSGSTAAGERLESGLQTGYHNLSKSHCGSMHHASVLRHWLAYQPFRHGFWCL